MTSENTVKHSLDEKLANGEISQEEYDEYIEKFGSLGLLDSIAGSKTSQKQNFKISGSRVFEGGEVDEDIKVTGKFISEGDLKCPSLKVSGKALVYGELVVVEDTKVSGKLSIDQDAKFGGYVKVSGNLQVGNNAYFTEDCKISGKLISTNEIISGPYVGVSGKIQGRSLKSSGLVKISGGVELDEDLLADEFVSSGGRSKVGGSIKATSVEIARKHRERMLGGSEGFDASDSIDSMPDIANFVTRLVNNIVPSIINTGSIGTPGTFVVEGNIEAKVIDISHTHVNGDLIGDIIRIGPGVTVDGVIRYKEKIEIPQENQYQIEQVD